MREHAGPHKATAAAVIVLMASVVCLGVTGLISLSATKPSVDRRLFRPIDETPKPDLSTLAPGAWTAVRKALGDDGLSRITNILSTPDQGFFNSQHGQSGVYHGHPYGLAFDIAVEDPSQGDSDARALRLQGVAAWYRGPYAPGSNGPFGGGPPHLHCVWPGAPTSNPVNLQQIASFIHGYRAAGNESPTKEDWRDPSIKSDEIACVMRAYYSIGNRKPLYQIKTYDSLHATSSPNTHGAGPIGFGGPAVKSVIR